MLASGTAMNYFMAVIRRKPVFNYTYGEKVNVKVGASRKITEM